MRFASLRVAVCFLAGYSGAMKNPAEPFGELYEIIKRLRSPEGCPWDKEQSPQSLRANLIEEAYECVEAINSQDSNHVREELGDVFLVITLLTYIYEQQADFSLADTLSDLNQKLIRRHPHVFGTSKVDNAQEVVQQWNDIKVNIEGRRKKDSLMDEVSQSLPPLERAYKMQKKAAKVGFDWQDTGKVWDKVAEELAEAREASIAMDSDALEDELGDVLFSVINVVRALGKDPSLALQRTISKFDRRFRYVEEAMKVKQVSMDKDSFTLMDQLWDEAKLAEKSQLAKKTQQ